MTKRLDLVGGAEAAEMLGLSRSGLTERRRAGDWSRRGPRFPEPVAELRCGPIWTRGQISEYADAVERYLDMDTLEQIKHDDQVWGAKTPRGTGGPNSWWKGGPQRRPRPRA